MLHFSVGEKMKKMRWNYEVVEELRCVIHADHFTDTWYSLSCVFSVLVSGISLANPDIKSSNKL